MECLRLLPSMIVAVLICAQSATGQVMTPEEFSQIAGEIIAAQARIRSLQVSGVRNMVKDDGIPRTVKFNYARSGEKEYRKTFWPTKVGETESDRYHVALWDGECLISYGSRVDNGSLRRGRSGHPDEPKTYSDVNRYFGHYTKGSLKELLQQIPAEQWVAAWVNPGKTLTLTCDVVSPSKGNKPSEWLLDATRGYMVSRYRILLRDADDATKFNQILDMQVTADMEVEPGVWIPTASRLEYKASGTTYVQELTLADILVNDPAIEKSFSFQWPKGSHYYDYTLNATVVPHATEDQMAQHVTEMADEMRSIASVSDERTADADASALPEQAVTTAPSEEGKSTYVVEAERRWPILIVAIGAAALLMLAGLKLVRRRPGRQR